MNSLSWFLYLAGVLDELKTVATLFAIFGGVAAVILTLCGMFLHCERYSWTTPDTIEWWEGRRAQCATGAKWMWPFVVVVAVMAILAPNKGTMYAIAASEVGERVAANEAVRGITSDATKALQQWIKRQIEPEKKS